MWQGANSTEAQRSVLNHWVVALLVLLAVAALSMRQINLYPPTADEFYSMFNSGWLVNSPYSPLDVIESLHNFSPNHTPGYFVLLSIWGNLVSYDLAVGRVLGVFYGLLSIAVTYRLARDFVAPAAAIIAILILASNAFSNFYIAHVRMYMLLLLMAGVGLWLYLRLTEKVSVIKRSDYLAMGLAVFFFLSVHAFGAVFLLTLAIYHLLFVPRGRRWLALVITGAAASLCAAPWYVSVATRGISHSLSDWSAESSSSWDTLSTWLTLLTNGEPLLLALSIAGLALAVRNRRRLPRSIVLLVIIQTLLVGVLNVNGQYIATTNLRYLLPGFLLYALLMSAGLYYLYSARRLLGILAALWLIAGISFQAATAWKPYIAGRSHAFRDPPWQVIEGMAANRQPRPLVIKYQTSSGLLEFGVRIPYTQKQHYFDRQELELMSFDSPRLLESFVNNNAIVQPRIWILYNRNTLITDEIGGFNMSMLHLEYDFCKTTPLGTSWTLLAYSWKLLECDDIEHTPKSRNGLIDHHFYTAELRDEGSELYFAEAWYALADFPRDNFAMSYQLISADWDNVAQLDLPFVHEGRMHRFYIDISDVSPGAYRLMAIVYDKRTGERVNWIDNSGDMPQLLNLKEIVIPRD